MVKSVSERYRRYLQDGPLTLMKASIETLTACFSGLNLALGLNLKDRSQWMQKLSSETEALDSVYFSVSNYLRIYTRARADIARILFHSFQYYSLSRLSMTSSFSCARVKTVQLI